MKENDFKKSLVIKVNCFTITAVSVGFTLLFYQIVCSMHNYVQPPWNEGLILNYQLKLHEMNVPFYYVHWNSTKPMSRSLISAETMKWIFHFLQYYLYFLLYFTSRIAIKCPIIYLLSAETLLHSSLMNSVPFSTIRPLLSRTMELF